MIIDTVPIQRFMQRVARMNQLKQSDIRLSIYEASELSASFAAVLAYHLSGDVSKNVAIDGGQMR